MYSGVRRTYEEYETMCQNNNEVRKIIDFCINILLLGRSEERRVGKEC